MTADLFNGDMQKAMPAALAIETFHNFTLIHDDIMDNAPLRRGKQTVHEKWGTNTAILSGDVMMVEANKQITRVDVSVLKSALETFNATAQGVCEGQQLDMEFESRNDVSIEEYIDMIRLKTAVLLGGAMKLGAIVAGANEHEAGLAYDFGENLGIAFQLQDDILDVYGDPEKFGKQIAGDIIANKKTFLLLKLDELASQEDKVILEAAKQLGAQDVNSKIAQVTELYNRYNLREIATQEMKVYLDRAFQAMDGIKVPEAQKKEIILLSRQLMNREY